MGEKDLIKIIKEELNEFDFLNNDKHLEEDENLELLSNPDFQKQFICDSLVNETKIRQIETAEAWIGGDWEVAYHELEDANKLQIQYDLKLAYAYDQTKEPVEFNILFHSDNIGISMGGNYDPGRWGGTMGDAIEPSGEAWFDYVNYYDIEVKLFSVEGDEIKFDALEKAPDKIHYLFVQKYVESYISDYTNLEIREKPNFGVNDVPYC